MAKQQTQEFVQPGVIVTKETRPDGSTRTLFVIGGVVFVTLTVLGGVWMILEAAPIAAYILAGGGAVGLGLAGYAVLRRSNQINHESQQTFNQAQQQAVLDIRLLRANVSQAEGQARGAHMEADNLSYNRHFQETAGGTAIIGLPENVPVRIIPKRTPAERRELLALPEPKIESDKLIDVLQKQFCVAIEGGRDAGKTVVALWWASFRNDGDLMIADPKGFGINPWPSNAWVADDDTSILAMVRRVAAEAKRRRDNRLFNERPIYLFIDELQWLVEDNEERVGLPLMAPFFRIIYLAREFGVHASISTGDGGVESLRVQGKGGLRRGLVWIEVNLNPITGERAGHIKHKPGQVFPVELPGVFAGRNQAKRFKVQAPEALVPAKSPEDIEAEKTAQFCRLVLKNGLDRKDACPEVFNAPYTGKRAQKLARALKAAEFH